MAQQYKIDKVNHIKNFFEENKDFIFNNFAGLTVAQLTDLRRQLNKVNAKFIVIKNNYVKKVIKDKNLPEMNEALFGPTGVVFSNKDISEALKILFKFTNNSPLKVKGGWAENRYFNTENLKELSKLPGREQLIAMLMATMNAPVQNFVYACKDVVTRFVRVLNAVAEAKK